MNAFDHANLAFFAFAAFMGLIASFGAAVMLRLERISAGTPKESLRALAGVCLGGGGWAAHFLLLLAFHPTATITLDFYLLAAGGALASGVAAIAFVRFAQMPMLKWRAAAIIAGILTIALALMHTLDIVAVVKAAHNDNPILNAVAGAISLFASLTVGLFYFCWGVDRVRRSIGASVVFVAIFISSLHSAATIRFEGDALSVAPAATSSMLIALFVCMIAVASLVAALAYLIVDRNRAVTRRTAESMASKLADAALEGLIVHDGEAIIEANARFSWLASDGTEAVRGQPLSDFFDAEALRAIRQTMTEGGEGVFETALQGADTDVEICTRLYDEAAGQYVTAVRDLSMRKRIDSAERANLAKSQFLANMSHELRTPLNAIIGYSEMIVEDSADRGAVRDAHEIHKAAKNMLALVNDIVDLSRIEDGKIDFCFDLCDFSEMIDRLERRFGAAAQAQGLKLEFLMDASASGVVIDEKRVEQCLAQMVSNAVKFTEKGGVSIRFFAEGEDFKVTVRDTGIGMAPDRAAQLFDAFSQGDGSIARRYGGVGVGLALTSRLVALMGGSLELETAEGMGSSFTMIAPSDPDPDILALRRKAGAHARVIKIIDSQRNKAA